jgi:hypothetical protein
MNQKQSLSYDELLAVAQREGSSSVGSSLGSTTPLSLSRKELERRTQPGETKEQASLRFQRECQLESDMDHDNRRTRATGQIMPIFYE